MRRALWLLPWLAGCGPPPPPPPPVPAPKPVVRPLPAPVTPPAPAREAFPTPAGQPREQRVLSKRFQLVIHLPDRPGWKLRHERSRFLVFDHGASASVLSIALWTDDRNMSAAACEEKARLWRDLPRRGKAIDERSVSAPPGFTTQLEAGFGASAPGEPIRGYLLAFGADGRRCFAFTYRTEAQGPGAEQLVGDRLAVIRGLTLERLELKSDIPQ